MNVQVTKIQEMAKSCQGKTFSNALQDYWNEWAGLLMFLEPIPWSEAINAYDSKVLITGGKLVMPFSERYDLSFLPVPNQGQKERVIALNSLAITINKHWEEKTLTTELVRDLSDQAKKLIYT